LSMDKELETLFAERDALFRNPRAREARLWWEKSGNPPPVDPTVPLATVHKARLQWLGATDEMIIESMNWLLARGYETTMMGAPPMTPKQRDAQRVEIGKEPLNTGNLCPHGFKNWDICPDCSH